MENAIVIRGVTKRFKKSTIRRDYTTFKTEFVRWVFGREQEERAPSFIEALRGVDLVVPKGKTVGIIGRNGSGKSTLLKIMTGIYSPTSGTAEIKGRVSALLDLGAGFHPDFSGRENVMINGIILGMSRADVKARMQQIIDFSELGDFVDEPVRTYSSGMFARLAFAVATHVDPDVLIIDEILAVGDEHFGRKSKAKMEEFKRAGRTIVLVTHDLGTVQSWCDEAAWLDGGKIRAAGAPHDVVALYRQAVTLAEAQGTLLGPPAISPDGGALPSPTSPKPSHGPAAASDKRSGDFRVEIERVRILGRGGREASSFDTEDPLEVALDFVAREPVPDVGFAVALSRPDGTTVYQTSTLVESFTLPSPLPPRGTIRLSIDRIGFTEGSYTVDVSAVTKAGAVCDEQRGLYPLTIHSAVRDGGVARPPHHWRLDGAEAEAVPRARVAVS
jgi:lipopolysaccharide transport system ATP-binding protein